MPLRQVQRRLELGDDVVDRRAELLVAPRECEASGGQGTLEARGHTHPDALAQLSVRCGEVTPGIADPADPVQGACKGLVVADLARQSRGLPVGRFRLVQEALPVLDPAILETAARKDAGSAGVALDDPDLLAGEVAVAPLDEELDRVQDGHRACRPRPPGSDGVLGLEDRPDVVVDERGEAGRPIFS